MAAVTIDTSTYAEPLHWSCQRRIDTCQGGVLWMTHYSGTAFEFWYSTDDGASWAQDSGATITPTSGTEKSIDLFIDLDDYVHVVWQDTSSSTTGLKYKRGTLNSAKTTITWGTATEINTTSGAGRGSVVAFRKPSGVGWYVAVLHETSFALRVAGLDATGAFEDTDDPFSAYALTTSWVTTGSGYAPCLDFNHTGDGKTVANNAPHLYCGYHNGATGSGKGIMFRKAVWSGVAWSANSRRSLDSSNHADATNALMSGAFDGTRFAIAYRPSTSTSTVAWVERDAGDTTTTARTPTALADGVVQSVAMSFDKDRNGYILASAATSLDPKWIKYTRSGNTWGSWTAIEATTALANSTGLQRGYSRLWIRSVFGRGAGSPYDVRYDRTITASTAPSASTWDSPTDNQAADVAETLTLDWTFVDVDTGDSQSAYALRRQIGAAAYAYWNAGGSSWGAGETKNTSTTTSVTLSASWGADGDDNHKYAVKTWDVGDTEGTYSDELTVIPSGQDNPTISTPADAGTVTTATLTVTWSATTQTAYKAELLNTGATTVHESSGWVTSTSTTHTFDYVMTNSTAYKVRITTKNDEGLASDADTNSFTASFTPPATPTLVVTANTPTGGIRVAITNGAGPPATTNVDLYRREGTDSSTSIRIAAITGSSPTYDDYAVESGTVYQYQAIGFSSDGASATSSWTA